MLELGTEVEISDGDLIGEVLGGGGGGGCLITVNAPLVRGFTGGLVVLRIASACLIAKSVIFVRWTAS